MVPFEMLWREAPNNIKRLLKTQKDGSLGLPPWGSMTR